LRGGIALVRLLVYALVCWDLTTLVADVEWGETRHLGRKRSNSSHGIVRWPLQSIQQDAPSSRKSGECQKSTRESVGGVWTRNVDVGERFSHKERRQCIHPITFANASAAASTLYIPQVIVGSIPHSQTLPISSHFVKLS